MRTHKASQKKSSASNPLVSRPLIVQSKPEENTESSGTLGYESQMPEFATFNPDRAQAIPVQPKLAIGAPGDKYEQEADRTAKLVVQRINESAIAQSNQKQSIHQWEISGIQAKSEMTGNSQSTSEAQRPNQTGLPDNLKSGIESLSGISMDTVKVHYNSSLPIQLNALAYAQGSDIHIAPGQEKHLPHEAWHIVQQAQGRVEPMIQMKNGVMINQDKKLETEADQMGMKAVQIAGIEEVRQEQENARIGLKNKSKLAIGEKVQRNCVVQLTVKQKSNGKYYSNLIPGKEFNTEEEALDAEDDLGLPEALNPQRNPDGSRKEVRPRTLFTYMKLLLSHKLPSLAVNQGPHTAGYAAVTEGLKSARRGYRMKLEGKYYVQDSQLTIDMKTLFSEQVKTPAEWKTVVESEMGEYIFDGKTEKSQQVIRAYNDYKSLYKVLKNIVDAKQPGEPMDTEDDDEFDLMHELMNLDPHATYKWWALNKVKSHELKGKGENRDLEDPVNIDKYANFKDKEAYLEFLDYRLAMTDGTYQPEESDNSDEDEKIDEDKEIDEYEVKYIKKDAKKSLKSLLPGRYEPKYLHRSEPYHRRSKEEKNSKRRDK